MRNSMKKILQKILTVWVVVAIFAAFFAVTVSAAPSVSIILSNKSPKVNDSVTVTVKVSGVNHDGAEFDLQYNPDVLTYKGSESYASGGGGIIHIADSYASASSHSFSLTFTALAAGSCALKVPGGSYVPAGSNTESDLPSAGYTLAVSDASKSDNANLSSLRPTSGTLSPRFSASTTSYTVTVPKNVETCNFSAQPADSGAKFTITPADGKLKIGDNKFEITVTAASGAQKKYTVVVTRTEQEEPVEEDPYEAQIGDNKFVLATDLTGILLPNGFAASTADYLGNEVAVATDKNKTFTLYYLQQKDDPEAKFAPYLLKSDEFIKVPLVTFGNNTYIISEFPQDVVPSSDYYETTLTLGDNSVIAYQKASDPDFYYLYCFYNDGFSVYRYDKKEDVLQRNPEFLLMDNTTPIAGKTESAVAPKPFTERFASLSSGAKIILILLLLAALIFIALLVFAYLTLMRSKREKMKSIEENMAFTDQPDDFDQIRVESVDEIPKEEE